MPKNYKLKLNIRSVERNLSRYIEKRMRMVVARIEGFVKNSISTNGNGVPSAPGSPPNRQSGSLIQSIGSDVSRDANEVKGVYGVLKGQIGKGSPQEYARRLELGFVGRDSAGRNINQRPRPFIVPAYTKNKRKIKKILAG